MKLKNTFKVFVYPLNLLSFTEKNIIFSSALAYQKLLEFFTDAATIEKMLVTLADTFSRWQ